MQICQEKTPALGVSCKFLYENLICGRSTNKKLSYFTNNDKTYSFLMFSGGIERDQWHEIN